MGVNEINKTIAQLNTLAQQNSSTSTELALGSQLLAENAKLLKKISFEFKLR